MNEQHYKVVVIGGGCLGGATAISLAQRLGSDQVCLLEKRVVGAGASSQHSGIVRASNRSEITAQLGQWALLLWQDIERLWGVPVPRQAAGALWIAPTGAQTDLDAWNRLAGVQKRVGIEFEEIELDRARQLTHRAMLLGGDERYFYEPHCYLYRPGDVLAALSEGFAKYGVVVSEHTAVFGFKTDRQQAITQVATTNGSFSCDYVINAAGVWSKALFGALGISLPIVREAVYAVNWLLSARALPHDLPIVADYQHLVYFRRWENAIMHMHQPRGSDHGASQNKASQPPVPLSANTVLPAMENYHWQLNRSPKALLQRYRDVLRARFPQVVEPVYAGGHLGHFDTTPDRELIVGFDPDVPNLVHCLGAGQAFKFAPALGELLADLVIGTHASPAGIDLAAYNIARFRHAPAQAQAAAGCAPRRCL